MEKVKHTQGKWLLNYNGYTIKNPNHDSKKGTIESIAECYAGFNHSETYLEANANAKRIVDCVNAMDGVDNPERYMNGVKLLEKEYHSQKDELGNQLVKLRNTKEELMESLKKMLIIVDDGKPTLYKSTIDQAKLLMASLTKNI